jgi:hypothetical protein
VSAAISGVSGLRIRFAAAVAGTRRMAPY